MDVVSRVLISGGEMIDENKRIACGSCFNEDLIIEIISRLPIKSLSRFKGVSKIWQSLIIDALSRIPLLGIFYSASRRDYEGEREEYTFIAENATDRSSVSIQTLYKITCNQSDLMVVHHCNGLVLLKKRKGNPAAYHICNPTTGQRVGLPEPQNYSLHSFAALAYNPRDSPHYKVVCLSRPSRTLEIFSSETGKWVVFSAMVPVSCFCYFDCVLFMNKALHFLVNPCLLIRFYVEEASFRCARLPAASGKWRRGCIGECKGILHYCRCSDSKLKIWELCDFDRHEWSLKHEVRHRTLTQQLMKHPQVILQAYFSIGQAVHSLAFHPEEEAIFVGVPHMFFCYNFNSGELKWVCQTDEIRAFLRGMLPFKSSLATLKQFDDVDCECKRPSR